MNFDPPGARDLIDALLTAAREAQDLYWQALGELELFLGCEIDGERLETYDPDDLVEIGKFAGMAEAGSDIEPE